MQTYSLQHSGIQISPLTLGTWSFGGTSWGGGVEVPSIEAVHAALDVGMTCIDTAPIYSNGKSEEIVGRALFDRRDKAVIASKCGLLCRGEKIINDLSRKNIVTELDASLRRLRTDYIDIYQCHWPDEEIPLEETFSTLNRLREAGKIRAIGVSNYSVEQLRQISELYPLDSSQDQYSLLIRDIEGEKLDYLRTANIGVLAYGPLAGGILTGKYHEPPDFKSADARKFFYHFYEGEAYERTTVLLDQLKAFGHPLNQLAINWVRSQPGVASVLVGCRNRQQVQDNMQTLNWDLTVDEIQRINDLRVCHS